MRLGDLDALAENLTLLAKYEAAFTAKRRKMHRRRGKGRRMICVDIVQQLL